MEVTIRGRNVEVTDRLRAAAEEKMGRLSRHHEGWEQAELVQVKFALPMTGRVIEIGATARWVKAARVTGAVGLQFSSLPADAHELIERYVTMMGGE